MLNGIQIYVKQKIDGLLECKGFIIYLPYNSVQCGKHSALLDKFKETGHENVYANAGFTDHYEKKERPCRRFRSWCAVVTKGGMNR